MAVITGSRGEYGYIRPILREIEATEALRYKLITTNLHLLPDFGRSVEAIEEDGFRISDRIFMALDGYTPASMSKSLGVFLQSFTDSLVRLRPDIVLLAGDRGEQLMAALAGAHMNIPVAHVQAGERSGNVDGMTRHAIARYSHLHFAANPDAAERLRRSGEQEFRIHLTGAPQLDELVRGDHAGPEEIEERFGISLDESLLLCVQHPVTEEYGETDRQVRATLDAVVELGYQTVVIFPNNDAGSEQARAAIERYCKPFLRIERNLPRRLFVGLMRTADAMVGNSSSGLIEAPVFDLPAVNVGTRQRGRYRGLNVLDVEAEKDAIVEALREALSPEFRQRLEEEGENPYRGDGNVSRRIVRILRDLEIDERLLKKQLTY